MDIVDVDGDGDIDIGSEHPVSPIIQPQTITSNPSGPVSGSLRPRRASAAVNLKDDLDFPAPESRSRSSAKPKGFAAPKLKLKMSDKLASQAPGTSFLGVFDRELDSDEEDLLFEEQFILRMAPGEDCDKLRAMVSSRNVTSDVWFKFKDSRRAVLHIGNHTYSAKLVDLPSIIEAQKTLDNKQMFKVADICQMLVVEDRISNDESAQQTKAFNVEEFIYPHGITPPMTWARKRRFRKRVNRRTIETIEQEVERLLEEDGMADDMKYDILENVNPDLSDSEFIDHEDEPEQDPPTPGAWPRATPGSDEGGSSDEGDIDEALAAELDRAMGDEEDDDEDDEDDSDEDEDDFDEDEDDEVNQATRLLNGEIRDLENAIAKKEKEIASSANPLIKRRFEDALKKLRAELELKQLSRDKQRQRAEGQASESRINSEDESDNGDVDVDVDDTHLPGEEPSADGQQQRLPPQESYPESDRLFPPIPADEDSADDDDMDVDV